MSAGPTIGPAPDCTSSVWCQTRRYVYRSGYPNRSKKVFLSVLCSSSGISDDTQSNCGRDQSMERPAGLGARAYKWLAVQPSQPSRPFLGSAVCCDRNAAQLLHQSECIPDVPALNDFPVFRPSDSGSGDGETLVGGGQRGQVSFVRALHSP